MNFKKIIWSNSKQKSEKDTLYLSIEDINHLERIWTKYKIIPQSIDEVQINFIVDRHKLIRFIIKELDIFFGRVAILLPKLTPSELTVLECLIHEPEDQIYRWVLGYEKKPTQYQKIIEKLLT